MLKLQQTFNVHEDLVSVFLHVCVCVRACVCGGGCYKAGCLNALLHYVNSSAVQSNSCRN